MLFVTKILIGFIRFLYGYYLILITKRRKIGEIGKKK